jgi:hypothetical protein
MIGGGSLSLKANERTITRERRKAQWKERTVRRGRRNRKCKRKQAALLADIV